MLGFFTGWINFYGWVFDLASLIQITANISVNLYVVYHQSTYEYNAWQVYVAYLLLCWSCVAVVVFGNRVVPHTQTLGMFFVVVGGIVTIIVVAAMPARHASSEFVWASFAENNITGLPGGVAFLSGVLNGAFTIGTPDAITHMAEELPRPRRDLPKAIGLQIGLGFLYAFVFAIAIMYAVTDLDALTAGANTYPLANIYAQATTDAQGNQNLGAQFGLLFIIWCSSLLCCVGTMVTVSSPALQLRRGGGRLDISGPREREMGPETGAVPDGADECARRFPGATGLSPATKPCLSRASSRMSPRASRAPSRQRCSSVSFGHRRLVFRPGCFPLFSLIIVRVLTNKTYRCRRHWPGRHPSWQLGRLHRPDGLFYHPVEPLVRDPLRVQRHHPAAAFPAGSVLARKIRRCGEYHGRGAHRFLRYLLLLP